VATGDTLYGSPPVAKPYPLRFDDPGDNGFVQFSDYDATTTIEAPPAADVFDLLSLAQH